MRWNLSQNDFYTQLAKKENYPARSVYKLREIDKKFNLFKPGDKVLDLGCAPGSWLSYLSRRVGDRGLVVGIDVEDLAIALNSNIVFIRGDVMNDDILKSEALWQRYQAVVSDLAPHTSGLKEKDAAQSLELIQRAWRIARDVLEPGGHFVGKVFEGEDVKVFIKELEQNFEIIKRMRPEAVRRGSKELYIVAKGHKKTTND